MRRECQVFAAESPSAVAGPSPTRIIASSLSGQPTARSTCCLCLRRCSLPTRDRAKQSSKRELGYRARSRCLKPARTAAGRAQAAARDLSGAARHAAYAAGQAAAVAHVAAHELGAAAYAIKAVRSAAPDGEGERAGRQECQWQRGQLPDAIRDLVLDDQRLRNGICWSVFDC